LIAAGLPTTDENIFIAAACKEKGIRFLKGDAEIGVRKIDKQAEAATGTATAAASHAKTAAPHTPTAAKPSGPAEFVVSVDGREVFMAFEGNMVTVDGRVFRVAIKPQASSTPMPQSEPAGGQVTEIKSQMPGAVYKVLTKPGDVVRSGEAILILEAMKMEMEIPSPINGTVQSVRVAVGDQVATGQVLATIRV
jgi:pyruvate carboxylase subunit B